MRRLRLILIWLVVLLGAALAAEGALRLLAPQYGSLYFSLTRTGGHLIHYNRHGLRDPERPLVKRAGTIRVLALGDSVTWGYGVGDRDLYVRLIEHWWNRGGRRPRLEVWNMAGMGRSARMYVPHIHRLLAYRPDAAIIQINLNDVGDAFRPTHRGVPISTWETPGAEQARKLKSARTPWRRLLTSPTDLASHLRLWLTRTYLGAWLIVQATRLSYWLGLREKAPRGRNRHEFMAFYDDDQSTRSWIEFAVNLIRLTRALRLAGVRVMWVIFPYRYQVDRPKRYLGVDPQSFPLNPQDRILFLAQWLKVPVLDLLPVFVRARRMMRAGQARSRPLFLLLDANHPDRHGHALAARAIEDFIGRHRWLSGLP